MIYGNELDFLVTVLKKCNVRASIINPDLPLKNRYIFIPEIFIQENDKYNKTLRQHLGEINNKTVYKISDDFLLNYIALLLDDYNILFIGPFLDHNFTHEKLLEWAEKYSLSPKSEKQLEIFYSGIPIIKENNGIFAMLDAFAEKIFETSDYSVIEHYINSTHKDLKLYPQENISDENTIINMQIMEARYAYENELMRAVSLGQTHKAELILSNFSNLSFEKRNDEPVRNYKNYCIIMNTLLRKAAENGGVHPIYLNSTSSKFAKKIETLSSTISVQELMMNMFRSYCNLVKRHSLQNYSAPVQKAIACIEADLTADLSLSALAKMQNISSGYLSAIFKKETGKTVTEYTTTKRMDYAKTLLKTTSLQIQTIAQHCGILDLQYFSKLFKKYTGKTPKEFRENL